MKRKEEKELLKKSGIYSIIALFAISIFWLLFSIQVSFGYSGTGTTQDLKSGSRVNGDLLAQPLNGSVTIYFGTQSTQGTGTTGYIGTNTAGLPKLKYSYTGGASAIDFIGFGAVKIDGTSIPSSGSVSSKLDAVEGVGTNNTFNNPTFAGSATIGTGSTITTGTSTFSGTKLAFLADVDAPVGAGIASKLTKTGTSTTYLSSVTADGKTGTASFSLAGGSSITFASTLNPDGSLAITADTSGSATAKADIREGGTTTISSAAHINFDAADFDASVDGFGATISIPDTMDLAIVKLSPTNAPGTSVSLQLYMATRTVSLYNGSSTLFLAHFNNAGTSTMADGSNYNRTITAVGDAIGTTTAYAGGGGLWTDGTGDEVYIADAPDLSVGSGDHTIEGKTYWISPPSNATMVGQWGGAGNRSWIFWANGANLYWDRSTDGTNNTNGVASSQSWTLGTFTSWAIERWGTKSYIYINGNQIFATSTASFTLYDATSNIAIGNDSNAVFDEVRISNFARYKGTYTISPLEHTVDSVDYTESTFNIRSPQTQNEIFKLISPGTVASQPSYVISNGSATIIGIGTTTPLLGTSNPYKCYIAGDAWIDGVLVTTSDKDKKVEHFLGTRSDYLEKFKAMKIGKWSWKKDDTNIYYYPFAGDPSTPEEIQTPDKKKIIMQSLIGQMGITIQELIERTEKQQAELDQLKAIVNP